MVISVNQSPNIIMNKGELIDAIADQSGITKKNVNAVLDHFFSTVQNQVSSGGRVVIVGFGSFEARERAARQGRNPKTGEVMDIPAVTVPVFSAGKGFKESVAGK